jgi:hypothetical protein
MLKISSIGELSGILSPERFAELEQLAKPKAKLPTVGSLADLVAQAKALRLDIRKADKEVKRAESYRTSLHWRYGQVLIAIHQQCKHGQWLKLIKTIGEKQQRADEAIVIAKKFPTEAAASKVTVKQALDAARRDPDFYNCYENCFQTPQWLRDAIANEYGYPGLDACASHGTQFGERFYAPQDDEFGVGAAGFDGLKQRWRKHCPLNRVVWCNSPYHLSVLADWIRKCYHEAQTGLVVIQLLPGWAVAGEPHGLDGAKELITRYAEIRRAAIPINQEGFGPKATKKASIGRGAIDAEVVIWRKGQMIPDTRIHPVKA